MELNENFAYSGTKQNFDRDSYATLAEMKAVKAKKMPSIFHATCAETGKLYIYDKTNTDDEILGKWREISGSSTSTESAPSVKEEYSIPAGYIIDFDEDDDAEAVYKKLELIYKSSNSSEPSIKLQGPNSYEFVNFNRSQGVYSTGFDELGNEVDFGYTRYTLTFKLTNSDDTTCTLSALYTDDGKKYEGLTRENCTWFTACVRDLNFGGIENFFNNNGPSLPIYSFTQGGKTSDEMFDLIGDSYYAYYSGDFGRGNEPFIVGETTSRAESCTVYIENAPAFGTQRCKLFAINTVGEVYEGFFVTTRTEPTFTSDGLVWRKVENTSDSEALTENDVEYIVQINTPAAVAYSKEVYDSMSGDELYKFLKAIYENVYQKTNNFDNIIAESVTDNKQLEITEFTCVSHNEYISPTVLDRITEYTLLIKNGEDTIRIAATGNLTNQYTNTSLFSTTIKITAVNPEFFETDTIDFTAWPEYTSPETNGIVLDGQGGANIDDSNVSVDPDDIEEED